MTPRERLGLLQLLLASLRPPQRSVRELSADWFEGRIPTSKTQEHIRNFMTLLEFTTTLPSHLYRTDRGNGSAGPMHLGAASDLPEEAERERVELCSETEDPEAWQLAREALEALGVEGPVTAVALGERDGSTHNGYQAVYFG